MSRLPPHTKTKLHIPVTLEEKAQMRKAARGNLYDWIRRVLNDAAEKEARQADAQKQH